MADPTPHEDLEPGPASGWVLPVPGEGAVGLGEEPIGPAVVPRGGGDAGGVAPPPPPPPPNGWVVAPPSMPSVVGGPSEKDRRTALGVTFVLSLIVIGLLVWAAVASSSSSDSFVQTVPDVPPASPAGHLVSAYQAAMAAGSVRFVTNDQTSWPSVSAIPVTSHVVGYTDGGTGEQTWVVSGGSIGATPERFTERLIGHTIYFNGNAPALVTELELSPRQAALYAGRWISLAVVDPTVTNNYLTIGLDSVTLPMLWDTGSSEFFDDTQGPHLFGQSSTPSSLSHQGPVTSVGLTPNNGCACGGMAGGSGALIVNNHTGLPISVRTSFSYTYLSDQEQGYPSSVVRTTTFSHWGVRVAVPAPAHAIRLTSIATSKSAPTS